ncbi:DUF262 domain-containing protein [Halapricum desulfuricans]|uniref:ParB-like nuclease domain containing protein fused to HNH nuclease n=1 Tax=Halapricum desulfuricans TaxID=2841257 RepID=A0A897NNM2_9EURY|nr:DUF262 domain-containing HNH endonuclease family protein [Halapricum desulfuricans]QSG14357.1 ParB-like nuclease domain containing protein fused to HNH nuclease [Halapricum desulfuricans]
MAIDSGSNHGIAPGVDSFHEMFSRNVIYTMELEEDVELQRLYTWEEKQIREFFDKIDEASARPEGVYLGTLKLTTINDNPFGSGATRLSVLDGQQRMGTAQIVLAHAVDLYRNQFGDDSAATHLESTYLETRTRDGLSRKMHLTVPDDSAFANLLDDPTQTVAHEILAHASTVIREEMEARVEDKSDLEDLVDNLMRGLIMDTVQFSDAYSPYQVFSDQSRGADLSPVDTAKARVLRKAASDPDEDPQAVFQEWLKLQDVLEDLRPARAVRYVLIAAPAWGTGTKIGESDIVPTIDKLINGGLSPHGLSLYEWVVELREYVQTYSDVVKAEVGSASAEINTHLDRIFDKIGARPTAVLLTRAVLEGLSDRELERLAVDVEKLAFRRHKSEAKTPQAFQVYIDLAVNAWDEPNSVDYIHSQLQEIEPTDVEFIDKLSSNKNWNAGKETRYFLNVLEHEHYRSGSTGTWGGSRHTGSVEHIAPRKAFTVGRYQSGWEPYLNVDQDEFECVYAEMLGNVTLLEKLPNAAVQNDPWETKRTTEEYKSTQYEMTRELRGQHIDWKTNQIEDRTDDLAELAADIWSL